MIPIADPELGADERSAVESVLESGRLADGPEVRAFEEEFADYCGVAHGVGTANGTAALHAALEAMGVGAGDHVVTSPLSFVASANAVRLAGGTPRFVDVDPETYNLDPDAVESLVRADDRVVGILPVHLYGLPADVDRLGAIADDHGLWMVEDAAQAHGARVRGEPVGSFGDAACFSFYPTKNMTTGEGGMVVTDDGEIARTVRRYCNHGRTDTYEHAAVGHNYRMPSVAAAIGRIQLERLPEFVERRRENAALLDDALADAPVETPTEPAGRRHAYHQYTVRTDARDALKRRFEDHDVGTRVYYPRPIHEQPAYPDADPPAPRAERLAEQVLSLPVHPGVTASDIDRIGRVAREFEVVQ